MLSSQFEVVRVDGEDYRHRGLPQAPSPLADDAALDTAIEQHFPGKRVALDDFEALVDQLSRVHPSRYRALIQDLDAMAWRGVRTIDQQAVALRFVVLADRLYDRDLPILSTGVPFDQVFTEEMMAGGYQKKYYRAVSRLTALAREADEA